jgi:S-adenosylmethionine:diacylglycerol 3-amino-3-carboxypropyl transferase
MYEDPKLELEVFPAGARVFAVASAGCTAFALAERGRRVTAVDVNPAQVEYARSRLHGGPFVAGSADRLLARMRRFAALVGWSRPVLEGFCALEDVAEQRRAWSERLVTRRLRLVLAFVLRPLALRALYQPDFVSAVPSSFDRILLKRLERGFATHVNRDNPYVRQLLLGEGPSPHAVRHEHVDLLCSDAAVYLERAASASFDGFALSNILDGANSAYAERLFAAIRRAAAPGAKIVLRSLGEPTSAVDSQWAARDRALIWGSIRVEEAA